ncbi:unnamed protein product [Musa acuminata subsp. malaccensis]|uniref:(wild Malaysian banana) hypothetical protein n=1 Tax=Musa acuminata subsp. malaccensis TaxID=214687 RepID=A0A804HUZ7_MUSAM|nr:unnamed protein product [Musa acuminata subsp. malaccensis]
MSRSPTSSFEGLWEGERESHILYCQSPASMSSTQDKQRQGIDPLQLMVREREREGKGI